ncbi:MAG: class I SAM-dependent methyltransferase [Sterolibacteriaceae bacterium]|uniref:Ubiquinone/menaquinone biosynthesis C-methyltransferase UbiE n=1 Tax=Candidatus Methylophosphatis roskildensis TaxID=2899263 RepID=A0A9D7E3H6_9PROT|nr:class I SAM-dependent methyltransferase [Candidatus Methylophosphatis roskildensis]MBK7238385.1 class I SAM-dependent methyltransferase [Sterolibacteriaceae bacterium]
MTPDRQIGAEESVRAPHPVLDTYYDSEKSKRDFVREIFDQTAADYDRVDSLLAFGSGSRYRRQALLRAGLAPGMKVLDVAVGTGLLSRQIVRVIGNSEDVFGIDPSAGMLASSTSALAISFLRGRAEALPFAAASFDFLSLGFALRHVDDMAGVFREFRRVLKPGGRVLALEITRPEGRLTNALLRFYMRGVVPLMSRLVARHRNTPRLYRYYWDTIEACAPPEQVIATLASAGFGQVRRHVELGIFSEYLGLG